jgi:heme-degrading monooxygenase HmoA
VVKFVQEAAMILRHWKGIAKTEEAANYANFLKTVQIPNAMKVPGFVRAAVSRREVDGGIEFMIITEWESEDAIRGFAGDDARRALIPDAMAPMLASWDEYATHYELVDRFEKA